MSLQSILILILGGAALLVGSCLSLRIIAVIRRVAASHRWRSTDGQVVLSTIRSRRSSTGSSRTSYPCVVYTYSVDGHWYRNDQLHFGSVTVGSGAEKKVAAYPIGKSVKVYYDPADPRQSVLECRAPSTRLLALLALLSVAFLGGGAMLVWLFGNSLVHI